MAITKKRVSSFSSHLVNGRKKKKRGEQRRLFYRNRRGNKLPSVARGRVFDNETLRSAAAIIESTGILAGNGFLCGSQCLMVSCRTLSSFISFSSSSSSSSTFDGILEIEISIISLMSSKLSFVSVVLRSRRVSWQCVSACVYTQQRIITHPPNTINFCARCQTPCDGSL